jgi:hypothetical protein
MSCFTYTLINNRTDLLGSIIAFPSAELLRLRYGGVFVLLVSVAPKSGVTLKCVTLLVDILLSCSENRGMRRHAHVRSCGNRRQR